MSKRALCSGKTSAFQASDLSFTELHGVAKSFFLFKSKLHGVSSSITNLHVVTDKLPTKKMPKLTETFAHKLPQSKDGTQKYWDSEIKRFVLFVGKLAKTWYFQKDVAVRQNAF